MRSIDFAGLIPRQTYHLLTRVVIPRPIALVSTISEDGRVNLAPFSYFTLGGLQPPSLVFCPVNDRSGQEKDTLRNIRATSEFVVHGVSAGLTERMNLTSAAFEYGVNEFEMAALTEVPSSRVRPPRVAEAPLALECRLLQVVTVGPGPLAANFVIGEVLCLHVAEDALDDAGLPDPVKLDLVARLGGDAYLRMTGNALFDLARPKSPDAPPEAPPVG